MKLRCLAAVRAPINSSLGNISGLMGATLDFAMTNDVLLLLQRKATAPIHKQ